MTADGKNVDGHKRTMFLDFLLQAEDLDGNYFAKLKQFIEDQNFRLIVIINDLRKFNSNLAPK